jgi:hypothetical protein
MIAAPGGNAGRPVRSYEQTAARFDWQFTRLDLDRLLRRLRSMRILRGPHDHHARTSKPDHLAAAT